MKSIVGQKMKLSTIIPWVAISLTACATAFPTQDKSTLNKINSELKQASVPREVVAPMPEAVKSSLLPPLRTANKPRASGKQLEERFDLVVSGAPIDQVLIGIVHDTRYSIMLRPKTDNAPVVAGAAATDATEKITVNLKNVTVFEALDSIREVYGYDYSMEGNRIYVQPPELQTRLYQVNYIIGQRRGVSDMQVIIGATSSSGSSGSSSGSSSSSSSSSGSSTGSGGGFGSVQGSALSTVSKSDLWVEIEDTLRTTLNCQIPKGLEGRSGGAGAAGGGSASSSGSSSASRADVSFVGETRLGERLRGVDGCAGGRSINVSQMSGTIQVRGMPSEHRTVAQILRSMQLNIERQVIIEAKIIDVELNSESQQGINWSGFQQGTHRFSVGADTSAISATANGAVNGGLLNSTSTLGGVLGNNLVGTTGSAFGAGLGVALQLRNFSALINFLQTQGHVHVLSSPRIATLNNQKAVIKVGSEEPFATNASGGSISVGVPGTAPVVTPPTITYQPFFSGIALDVTPQIDDQDGITLQVHSMINNITVKDKLAIIGATASVDRLLSFAVNSINETDNVVKTKDGQVIVIGGLMTESAADNRSKIPGAGDVPVVGSLFKKGAQSSIKRELVILLKPTVVKDDSAWTNDINATQGRIEGLSATQAPTEKN